MTPQEIHNTMEIIRQQTMAFIKGGKPTLDEIESFCVFLSFMTFNRLLCSTQKLINTFYWNQLISNTVKKIILENF